MTTIIGIQGDGYCLVAGDTQISSVDSNGTPYQKNTLRTDTSKIAVNGKYLIGTAGDLRAINLLTHTLNPPVCPPHLKGKKLDEFITNKLIPSIKHMFESNGYTNNTPENPNNKATHDSNMIVAVNQSIYLIDGDYAWFTDSTGNYAIGTGTPYALGALLNMPYPKDASQAKKNALKALATAAKYDPNTGPPFHTHIQQIQQKTVKSK